MAEEQPSAPKADQNPPSSLYPDQGQGGNPPNPQPNPYGPPPGAFPPSPPQQQGYGPNMSPPPQPNPYGPPPQGYRPNMPPPQQGMYPPPGGPPPQGYRPNMPPPGVPPQGYNPNVPPPQPGMYPPPGMPPVVMYQSTPGMQPPMMGKTPMCLHCHTVTPWIVEPLFTTVHWIVFIILLFFFGFGLLYLLIIALMRSNPNNRAKICPVCGTRNQWTVNY